MTVNTRHLRPHSRSRLAMFLGLAAVVAWPRSTEVEAGDDSAAPRPNIVCIMADDNSYV